MTQEHFKSAAESLTRCIMESISGVSEEDAMRVVELILAKKRIFVYGVGRSGLVGKSFAMRLVQLGLESFFIGETITPIVTEEDVVVIVSNTGATMSAIQTANIVRRVGGVVVAVTEDPHSKLATASNVVFRIPVNNGKPDKFAPLGTRFEEAAMLSLDALVAVIMKRLGESDATMRARHAILV